MTSTTWAAGVNWEAVIKAWNKQMAGLLNMRICSFCGRTAFQQGTAWQGFHIMAPPSAVDIQELHACNPALQRCDPECIAPPYALQNMHMVHSMTTADGWRVCEPCFRDKRRRLAHAQHIVPLSPLHQELLRQAPPLEAQLLSLVDMSFNLKQRLHAPKTSSFLCGHLVHEPIYSIAFTAACNAQADGALNIQLLQLPTHSEQLACHLAIQMH